MALDTLPTTVTPGTVKQYLAKLDERGETYGFNVTNENTPHRDKPLVLTLYREGGDDALELRLSSDNTWTANHVIVVGEERE